MKLHKEFIVAEYLEGLSNDAVMQDVFNGLYQQGQELADEIRARFGGREFPLLNFARIPGTDLEAHRMVTSGDTPGNTFFEWTEIQAKGTFRDRQFEIVEFVPQPRSERNHTDPAFQTQPAWIAAYRDSEVSPDYRLSSRGLRLRDGVRGLIVCKLDNMGIRNSIREACEEVPVGTDMYEPERRVEDLSDEERQRLGLVTQGIAKSLALVDTLKDGTSLLMARIQAEAPREIQLALF